MRLAVRISKAAHQPALFTVAGDGSIKGNPELIQKQIVDRRGVHTTRYVRPKDPVQRTPAPARPTAQRGAYDDSGEHIPLSRKELAALRTSIRARMLEISDLPDLEREPGLAHELVTLDQVTGPDFLTGLKELGYSSGAAFLITKLWSVMLKRPEGDSAQARLRYALGVQRVIEAVRDAHTVQDVAIAISNLRNERLGVRVPAERVAENIRLQTQVALLSQRLQETRGRALRGETLPPGQLDEQRSALAAANSAYRDFKREIQRADDALEHPMSACLASLGDRFRQYIGVVSARDSGSTARTRDKHQSEARRHEASADWSWREPKQGGQEPPPKAPTDHPKWERLAPNDVLRRGGSERVFTSNSIRDVFRLRGVQYGNWMDEESSREHTQHAGEALLDLAEILGVEPHEVSLNGRLGLAFGARGKGNAKAHYEPALTVVNLTKTRGGGSLAHEWGHFLDNVIARVSHNGTAGHMTMAFAATGASRGGLGPHLEAPIVTALKGVKDAIYAGTYRGTVSRTRHLKLDNVRPNARADLLLQEAHGDPNAAIAIFLSGEHLQRVFRTGTDRTHRRIEVQLRDLADYLSARTGGREVTYDVPEPPSKVTSTYVATAKRMGSYWSRPDELFARAFEAFISDQLERRGQRNTYLVAGVDSDTVKAWGAKYPILGRDTSLYPLGEERQRINQAFLTLISALKQNNVFAKALHLLLAAGR